MQRIFPTLKQAFRKSVLIVVMLSLFTLSSLFIFVEQPLAAPISTEGQKLIQQENLDKQSQAEEHSEAYEAEVEAEKNPDKVYKENLKTSKEPYPGEGLVQKTVREAEKLVDKVTGKE